MRSMAPVLSSAALTINIPAIVSGAEFPKTQRVASSVGSASLSVIMLTKSKTPKTVIEVRSAEIRSQMKLVIAKINKANTNRISQVI